MLIVTNKTQIPNIETISKNVRYELTESNDGTITLTTSATITDAGDGTLTIGA